MEGRKERVGEARRCNEWPFFDPSGFVHVHPPSLFLPISPRITIFEDIWTGYGERNNRQIEDDAVAIFFQGLKVDRARRHSEFSAAGKRSLNTSA
ncbi:hypothetical protein GJ744_003619 [Endocarpon pusillum]|uniref:Uncharacterized protein n=1 Tax=Endocarpon pusillum TaxID=364733 RepID=A0A8H7E202_9EURO|nr:hypothetical protein GJ744_003619 [Endocarpon pusillum]